MSLRTSVTPVTLSALSERVKKLARPEHAALQQRFFKTGPGGYGEGDRFLGISVPPIRALAREFKLLSLKDTKKLLRSEWHEERLLALILLISHYRNSGPEARLEITEFYLANSRLVNSWDLVDASAEHLVGPSFPPEVTERLETLAHSELLWDRRIAIIATFHYIRQKVFGPTLRVAELLLNDDHDLMHKAVGWMLREVGKRSQRTEEEFLKPRYKAMPRTMLRYAIEKFPEPLRLAYLKGTIT